MAKFPNSFKVTCFARKLWHRKCKYLQIWFPDLFSVRKFNICRFQIYFQGPLHIGKLEWWIDVCWFCTSEVHWFLHRSWECRCLTNPNINMVRIGGKLRHWRTGINHPQFYHKWVLYYKTNILVVYYCFTNITCFSNNIQTTMMGCIDYLSPESEYPLAN